MPATLLGGPTSNTGSPRLWFDSDRAVYLVQGYQVLDEPNQVEIPHMLLKWLRPGTFLGARLHDSGQGSFIVAGTPVSDPTILRDMAIPDHETAVEVPVAQSRWEW